MKKNDSAPSSIKDEKQELGFNKDFPRPNTEFFKLPIRNLDDINKSFANMQQRLEDYFVKHPEDKGKYAVAIVPWNCDVDNPDYKEGESWLAVWATLPECIERGYVS